MPSTVPAPIAGLNYKLVWSDDFTGTSLNSSNWTTQSVFGGSNTVASSWNNFTYNNSLISVANSIVNIEGVNSSGGYTGDWQGAQITTLGFKDWSYGFIEGYILLPTYGAGFWPCFWMYGTAGTGNWEIDILEYPGGASGFSAGYIQQTLHDTIDTNDTTGPNLVSVTTPNTTWHLFQVLWTPTGVTFYVDGVANGGPYTSNQSSETMEIIFNFDIGPSSSAPTWTSLPNSSTPSSANYSMDYVRVWQLVSTAPTGFTLAGTGTGTYGVQSAPMSIFLNGPAGSGGVTLNLASTLSGNTDTFQPSSTITIPSGSSSATFYITPSGASGTRTVSATSSGLSQIGSPVTYAATGNIYYVATTGSDSAAGTSSAPWLTIQKATSTVVAGDTVHVASGTYTTSAYGIQVGSYFGYNNGTSGAPITFISDVQWGAKLYNPGGVTSQQVWDIRSDYIIVKNFDISGNGSNGVWAGILTTGSYNQFIGNYVHDIAVPSNMTTGGSGGIGSWTEAGSYAGHNVIAGNICVRIGTPGGGNLWHGIYDIGPYSQIYNNICCHNMSTGITNGHWSTNQQIVNNVCLGNGNSGIYIGGGTEATDDYSVIANNICIYNAAWGIQEDDNGYTGPHEQYLNNCVYGNTLGGIYQLSGDLYPASGTITSNPLFVNYQIDGTGNYQLTSGSPCIGAGTPTDMPIVDFLGVTRPSGGPYDIGAYQYQGSSAPTTATLSGPTSGALGQKSTVFSVTLNTAATVPVTVTITSSNSTDVFTSS